MDYLGILLNKRAMPSFESREIAWQEGKIKNPGYRTIGRWDKWDKFDVKVKN